MLRFRTISRLLAGAILVLAFSAIASAQATRTWVSGTGDDANPCSRTAPCKTFAGAISKTAPAGEIDCLDPGGFGAVTITKSITIDCGIGPEGVLVSGTNGIVIAANASTDVITLRHVNIVGLGTGLSGILVNSAKEVHLDNVIVKDFTTAGLNVGVSATLLLTVKDSLFSDNPNAVITHTTVGVVAGDFDHVQIYDSSANAFNVQNGSRLQIHNSTIFACGAAGVIEQSLSTGGASVLMTGSSISLCSTALESAAGGLIGVSNNVFTQNNVVYNPNGGSISSAGDNVPYANPSNGTPNGPAITKI